jgi:CheY-like chemotaxis protein
VLELLTKVRQRGRILVADGDAGFIGSVVPVLESAGYDVEVATTGAEALEKMISSDVDCLVLDLRLPVLSGAELYARLIKAGRQVPTVLVTGDDGDQDPRLESQSCGMLFKPFDPNTLLAAIGSAVSLGQAG